MTTNILITAVFDQIFLDCPSDYRRQFLDLCLTIAVVQQFFSFSITDSSTGFSKAANASSVSGGAFAFLIICEGSCITVLDLGCCIIAPHFPHGERSGCQPELATDGRSPTNEA